MFDESGPNPLLPPVECDWGTDPSLQLSIHAMPDIGGQPLPPGLFSRPSTA